MRTAIILARKHGGKTLSVISGPEVGIAEQFATFKSAFMAVGEHAQYSEVELWTSDAGRTKFKRLDPIKEREEETTRKHSRK